VVFSLFPLFILYTTETCVLTKLFALKCSFYLSTCPLEAYGKTASILSSNSLFNQRTIRPTDRPTDRSTDRPTDQPTNQPTTNFANNSYLYLRQSNILFAIFGYNIKWFNRWCWIHVCVCTFAYAFYTFCYSEHFCSYKDDYPSGMYTSETISLHVIF